jgi:hypothetical protein
MPGSRDGRSPPRPDWTICDKRVAPGGTSLRGFGIRHSVELPGPDDVRRMIGLMSPYEAPEEPADAGPPDREDQQALPVQSREDTDIAWSEQPEHDEDDRLYRDRPPHWDSR